MTKKSVLSKSKLKPTSKVRVVSNTKQGGLAAAIKGRWGATIIISAFIAVGLTTLIWAQAATSTYSLWAANTVPKTISYYDSQGVEVGVKFKAKYAGTVTGMRFYKGPQNTGKHVGSLWTQYGTELARVDFKNETASGWQTAAFSQPVSVSANTTYVVSYYAPKGYYSVNTNYFTTSRVASNNVLTTPKNAGVYAYSRNKTFPNATYGANNYWVDVLFSTSRFTPSPKPSAPADLTARISGGVVNLQWKASPTTGLAKYDIIRNDQIIGAAGGTSTAYNDATIVAGMTYSYQVQAVDTAGTASDKTGKVSITVPPSTPVPPAPPQPPTTTPPVQQPPVSTPNPVPPTPPSGTACTYSAASTSAGCGFPSGTTTGVPVGVRLPANAEATGSAGMVIDKDGTVIDGRYIRGWLDIRANNVTIQNSKISSTSWSAIKVAAGKSGLKVLHSEISGGSPENGAQNDYGVNMSGNDSVQVGWSNIYGFKDGVVASSAWVHDNYIHGNIAYPGAHTQCIYVYSGGSGVTIENNTLVNPVGKDNTTAAIYIAPDSANQNNHLIQYNWLSGGAYTVYGGDAKATNIKLLNNVFSTEVFPPSGSLYGPIGYWHPGNAGVVANGNIWGNGANAGKPVNP